MSSSRGSGQGPRYGAASASRAGRTARAIPRAGAALLVVLAVLAAVVPGAARAQDAAPEATVLEVVQADDRFQTFLAAAHAAGLAGVLAGEGPVTVFVPTDQAFHRIAELDAFLADDDALRSILELHVVPRAVRAAELAAASPLTTLHGAALEVRVVEGTIYVGDAIVTITDVQASNGAVHAIDTVLAPPE